LKNVTASSRGITLRSTGNILLGQFGHFFLDRGQIVRRERALVREIVKEAVLDHRTDRHLRVGEQRLHRVRQQVRGRMANHVEAVGILVGDDGQLRIGVNQVAGIHQFAVDPAGKRRLGQPGADAGCDLCDRDRGIELPDGAIGKRDIDHFQTPDMKKARAGRAFGYYKKMQKCLRTAMRRGLSSDSLTSSR
jgi:hypothetical protein